MVQIYQIQFDRMRRGVALGGGVGLPRALGGGGREVQEGIPEVEGRGGLLHWDGL